MWAGVFCAVLSTVAAGWPMIFTSLDRPPLSMPTNDVDSLLRFLDSDIELSISRILMSR